MFQMLHKARTSWRFAVAAFLVQSHLCLQQIERRCLRIVLGQQFLHSSNLACGIGNLDQQTGGQWQ